MTNGLPDNSFVRAVREDPAKKGLLYWAPRPESISRRHGARWWPLRLNAQGVADAEKARSREPTRSPCPRCSRTLADEEPSGLSRSFAPILWSKGMIWWSRPRAARSGSSMTESVASARALGDRRSGASVRACGLRRCFGGPSGGGPGQNPPRGVLFYYWLKE